MAAKTFLPPLSYSTVKALLGARTTSVVVDLDRQRASYEREVPERARGLLEQAVRLSGHRLVEIRFATRSTHRPVTNARRPRGWPAAELRAAGASERALALLLLRYLRAYAVPHWTPELRVTPAATALLVRYAHHLGCTDSRRAIEVAALGLFRQAEVAPVAWAYAVADEALAAMRQLVATRVVAPFQVHGLAAILALQ